MIKMAFFDAKPYEIEAFRKWNSDGEIDIRYMEHKLNVQTVDSAKGCDVVCAFVNDTIDAEVLDELKALGVKLVAMRCAGYNNLDLKALGDLKAVRVPAYSPHAVAEHAMALLLTLNRKTHKAYNRTREFNFSLNGLTGVDLYGKTVGVVGTGRIGRMFIDICRGFGMKVIAYDMYPVEGIDYVDLDTLFRESDFISLHCPLTDETHHMVDEKRFAIMKDSAILINTSRGALVDSVALVEALWNKQLRAVGLDVYEEEANYFFEDCSGEIVDDATLQLLVSMPNVLLTSHQAFLTEEALSNIAETTLNNVKEFFHNNNLVNEIK
ncbi:2-hydroxyacid dehydrogenase [Laedolimicola intestinihominis]|mgnify:FL=1|uniref:2-hydroxyacid dehydrogenase n=1 Tax=Laedolimicola intestinihominis TaxID=3133166 RepID=A0ABV1FGY4_9FIRM